MSRMDVVQSTSRRVDLLTPACKSQALPSSTYVSNLGHDECSHARCRCIHRHPGEKGKHAQVVLALPQSTLRSTGIDV